MKKIFKKIIAGIMSWEAKLILKKYKPKIVVITGSVGKTSTKDAIYSVLATSFFVRKSEKSFNSDIGLPLTILGCENGWYNPFLWIRNIFDGLILILFPHTYPAWLVLEVGADSDRPTYMQELSKWLKSDIAVYTVFAKTPVHVEFFGSREKLIEEKSSLAYALKDTGTLILNSDDRDVMELKEAVHRTTITYGIVPGADIFASHDEITYAPLENSDVEFPNGITFRIDNNSTSIPIHIKDALGRQHIYTYLAAYAVGVSQNINAVKISEALAKHVTPKGRMKLIAGIKDTLIIDDTYNSSPIAVEEGLATMKAIHNAGKKIAILGDMMELGEYSSDAHRDIGMKAANSIDILITVGIRARGIADGALDGGLEESNILQFETSEEAGKYMIDFIKDGDIIFVKGSQSMRMERVVEEIMYDREHKEDLLVRQDAQWKKIS